MVHLIRVCSLDFTSDFMFYHPDQGTTIKLFIIIFFFKYEIRQDSKSHSAVICSSIRVALCLLHWNKYSVFRSSLVKKKYLIIFTKNFLKSHHSPIIWFNPEFLWKNKRNISRCVPSILVCLLMNRRTFLVHLWKIKRVSKYKDNWK